MVSYEKMCICWVHKIYDVHAKRDLQTYFPFYKTFSTHNFNWKYPIFVSSSYWGMRKLTIKSKEMKKSGKKILFSKKKKKKSR